MAGCKKCPEGEALPGCEHTMCRACFIKLREDKCPTCHKGWESKELKVLHDKHHYYVVKHNRRRLSKADGPNVIRYNTKGYREVDWRVVYWDCQINGDIEPVLQTLLDNGFEEMKLLRNTYIRDLLKQLTPRGVYKYDKKSKCFFVTRSKRDMKNGLNVICKAVLPPATMGYRHYEWSGIYGNFPRKNLNAAIIWIMARHKGVPIEEAQSKWTCNGQ